MVLGVKILQCQPIFRVMSGKILLVERFKLVISAHCCRLSRQQAVIQRKAPPGDITASVILVVAGCLIAGLGDFTFDLGG